jgi:hypothetical protein
MISLKSQIERIIDEGEGDRRQVIVSALQSPDDASVDKAAEVLRRRRFISSAHDVLPCPNVFPSKTVVAGQGDSDSLFLNSRAFRSPATTVGQLKEASLRILAPLIKSDVAQKSFRESQELHGADFDLESSVFWPAQAIYLDISRDDLREFLKFDQRTIAVFANRIIPKDNLAVTVAVTPLSIPPGASAWGVQRINAPAVWGAYGVRGRGVRIGILDSGVDEDHDDLKGKVKRWVEFDKCGRPVKDSKPHDAGNHGTVCAGTLVGGNHSGEWVGVAPDATLAAALVLDAEGASYAQILAGMTWAIDQQVDVLNMSLGRFIANADTPPFFARAIFSCIDSGILPIIPIGNEGEQTSDTPGSDLFAFSVGGTGYHDEPAGFSGGRTQVIRESPVLNPAVLPYVYRKPDISAPGVAVKTTIPHAASSPTVQRWDYFSGTSLSTTHVSGAIALLLSATNIRDVTQGRSRAWLIQDLISGSAEELGESGLDARFGLGRIDVLRAIAFAHKCGYEPS